MSASPVRNLHVPLAREAIDSWLAEQRRATIHEGIAAYAMACAGTTTDIDPALESAAVEHLLEQDEGTT